MLRYRADVRTLGFIAAYFVLVGAEWTLAPLRPLAVLPLVALTCVLTWSAAVITHNSIHSPVFKQRWMNRVFQVVLTLSYGFPVSEYYPGHNISHHKFTQTPRDAMRTGKVRYRFHLLNFIVFPFRAMFDVLGSNMRYTAAMKHRNPRWYRQFLTEAVIGWGTTLALFALDWRKCILFVLIPHFYAVWSIVSVNFLWHDGCDPDHKYNHSRNIVGPLFNWFTFNNGFHGVHHDTPGLHWSLAPKVHRETIHPFIHPALEQHSLVAYLFNTFVRSQARLRFDGAPVVYPAPIEPDEDWTAIAIHERAEVEAS